MDQARKEGGLPRWSSLLLPLQFRSLLAKCQSRRVRGLATRSCSYWGAPADRRTMPRAAFATSTSYVVRRCHNDRDSSSSSERTKSMVVLRGTTEQQAQLLYFLHEVAVCPLVLWPKLRFYLKKAWFCGWIQHAWRRRSLAPNLTQVPNQTQRDVNCPSPALAGRPPSPSVPNPAGTTWKPLARETMDHPARPPATPPTLDSIFRLRDAPLFPLRLRLRRRPGTFHFLFRGKTIAVTKGKKQKTTARFSQVWQLIEAPDI